MRAGPKAAALRCRSGLACGEPGGSQRSVTPVCDRPEGRGRAEAAAAAPVETELVGSVLDPVPPPSLAIYKEHKHSTRRIDLAVCAITANSVATTISPVQLYWLRRREKAGSR